MTNRNTNLSDEEIEKMRKEAEEHAEEDKKRKEEADTINEAEQLVFQTEKSLKDLGDKVTDSEKTETEALIKDLKDALEKKDVEDIKAKKEKLLEKANALATRVYQEAAQAQQAQENNNSDNNGSDEGNGGNSDNVQDATYEEK